MSGRGGIYEGRNGEKLHGDGRRVENTRRSPSNRYQSDRPPSEPDLYCGLCLRTHAAMLPLAPDGSCPCCKGGHQAKPDDGNKALESRGVEC